MADWRMELSHYIVGPLFPLVVAITYLGGKLFIRYLVHCLISEPYDWWNVCTWTGVDGSILIATVSITVNAPKLMKFSYEETVIWYLVMAICMIACTAFYGLFTKRRRLLGSGRVITDIKSVLLMTLTWGAGLAFAAPTIKGVVIQG